MLLCHLGKRICPLDVDPIKKCSCEGILESDTFSAPPFFLPLLHFLCPLLISQDSCVSRSLSLSFSLWGYGSLSERCLSSVLSVRIREEGAVPSWASLGLGRRCTSSGTHAVPFNIRLINSHTAALSLILGCLGVSLACGHRGTNPF